MYESNNRNAVQRIFNIPREHAEEWTKPELIMQNLQKEVGY